MQVGISTASLFGRRSTLGALELLADKNIDCAEVFLESFCEYNKRFGKKLNKVKGKVCINSVHTLTTQFEPQLFSANLVAKKDSFDILKGTLACAKAVGAKNYTFHGGVNFKKMPYTLNFDKYAKLVQDVIDECDRFGVNLAYENVHWAHSSFLGFFTELKKRTSGLKTTLDIKQARLSGIDTKALIKEMGDSIVTVHISDIDSLGNMCLPLSPSGTTDFNALFSQLAEVNFKGAILLESYFSDYTEIDELFESYQKIKDLANGIFNK